MTFHHRSPLTRELPHYDDWHHQMNGTPHGVRGTVQAPLNRYYSKPLARQGSYHHMFWEDALEPGPEYRDRSPHVTLNAKPHLHKQNVFVKDTVDKWGRRLQQNRYNNQSMFAHLGDAYWENPWDIYQVNKPYQDFQCVDMRIAHENDVRDRWFR